ncbi:acetoin utilization protein AcuC [Marininema halotolerans]|uniref:Acetoin utilization protein AcuC n=1 Tax=Marininema halotolerans TaxID=1155944 RepID=A0A1I6PUW9_9BACL|nr:acetoin utilization protein AcuC [Marininema halotolerans]SFS43996.1 acetoin utilization protein AcuC [Marininema halotolerans]
MNNQAVMITSDDFLKYRFSDTHPFNNQRLELTLDMIRSFGLLNESDIIPPRMATDEELALAHDPTFIDVIKHANSKKRPQEELEEYGLCTQDNPVFPGMHEAAALVVGGTLTAAEAVMSGRANHALNLSGGLHHGFKDRVSGFCIYNDASVAIAWLRKHYDARVMYIDTDAHHGDGVQWSFYDDPNVMSLSIHETGRCLFPGTGNVYERGKKAGLGTTVNIPLEAFTENDSFMDTLHRVLPTVTRSFQPDIIISQNGCDAHRYDPLTHLAATMDIYQEIPRLIHELAHEYCQGRLVAVGGGGYDIWRVVPRAWTYLWAELSHQPLGEADIPQEWFDRWGDIGPDDLPTTLHDQNRRFRPIPNRDEISKKNSLIVDQALQYFP